MPGKPPGDRNHQVLFLFLYGCYYMAPVVGTTVLYDSSYTTTTTAAAAVLLLLVVVGLAKQRQTTDV